MANFNYNKKKEECDFFSVFPREKVREIDKQILKVQQDYEENLRQTVAKAKDFVITD